jgi:hypothetical protein
LVGGYGAQLLPSEFFEVTLSGQHPYCDVVQSDGAGAQLLPFAFLVVTLSGQQPYCVPAQPIVLEGIGRVQLVPSALDAVMLLGQHP